ncbi:hypothetical protein [Thiobacillus sedimenti]|uniref:Secreted protein n=1 Tax=Thiobacillus sedimenti TaxID=3110231 RepID=A0ABZ1CI21_9PROT|nr:hypothetical protein [Thiobacillus sp. SCUT-2]WRS39047.1 hypothetical protein VA613_13705 [Thiobacillus sp. SCUT-2]
MTVWLPIILRFKHSAHYPLGNTRSIRREKRNMEWQTITGISSVVIALCALVFSFWQGAQTKKHNRLSVRPHLTTWTHSNSDKGFYAVELVNNGIGPAIIEDFVLKIDGKQISGNGTEPIEKALKILFPNFSYHSNHSYLAKNYSIVPKERCIVVSVQFLGPQFPAPEVVEHALNRGDLEISYKSFYEENFHFSSWEEKSNKPDRS